MAKHVDIADRHRYNAVVNRVIYIQPWLGIKAMEKMNLPPDRKVTIKIPRPLYNSLKDLIENSGFNSVNDFVVYVLRDIASIAKTDASGQFENDEIETIKERLRNLGYM